jgi:DNA-binding beta-propeller fold protein YncE
MAIKMGTPKPKAQDANLTIQNASYSGTSFDVSGQDDQPMGIFFNSVGTKMFMVGRNPSDSVHQYTLGTGFDLSSASYDSVTLDVSGQDDFPQGIFFNASGTKMFMVGNGNNSVHQYTLGTGFDLSTATYDSISLDVSSQDNNPQGIYFNSTGTKMLVVGRQNDSVYQYTLGTGFDLSTASYDSISFSVSQDNSPSGIFFNPTGTKMFMVGQSTKLVYEYNL